MSYMLLCPQGRGPGPTFNWVLEYQPKTSKILKQPSHYRRSESNLLADAKRSQHFGHLADWVIHLYLYIHWTWELDLDVY